MADDQKAEGVGLGYIIYQQVAGVLGAIALAALLGNFIKVGWYDALRDVLGVWDTYVRPATKWFLDTTVVAPLHWVGIQIEIPKQVRDYYSMGVIATLGYLRALRALEIKPQEFWWGVLFLVLDLTINSAIWPIVLLKRLLETCKDYPSKAPILILFTVQPFIFTALLLAANYLLLRPGS